MKHLLWLLLPLQANALSLDCTPYGPPRIQGAERFAHIEIANSKATLEVTDLVAPFQSITSALVLSHASYSEAGGNAAAQWRTKDGTMAIELALVSFGSWWGANLRFSIETKTSFLKFRPGEELEFICR